MRQRAVDVNYRLDMEHRHMRTLESLIEFDVTCH